MKCVLAAAALAGAVSAASVSENVTPVEKVLQMLTEMSAKGKAERKAEQVQFSAYSQFCGDASATKTRDIAEAANSIERLNADILKAETDAAGLQDDVENLERDIGTWKSDQKGATAVREKEKLDFQATHRDYSESIDALERAIYTLKKQNFDRKQAADALLQVDVAAKKSAQSATVLAAWLARGKFDSVSAFLEMSANEAQAADSGSADVGMDVSAPEANGYEFQSGGVIQMLQQLEDKFNEELSSLSKEEKNTAHAYELMMQDLTGQIDGATQSRDRRAANRGARLQAAAVAQGELVDVTKATKTDEAYLADLKAECAIKSEDFGKRQQLRLEEIQAIDEAIGIIGGSTVNAHAEKYLPSLIQKNGKHSVFLQLSPRGASMLQQQNKGKQAEKSLSAEQQRTREAVHNALQERVAEFLQDRAAMSNSKMLLLLSEKVQEDPFGKVKKMIRDMISKLMAEATAETEHKGWCDAELATNKM